MAFFRCGDSHQKGEKKKRKEEKKRRKRGEKEEKEKKTRPKGASSRKMAPAGRQDTKIQVLKPYLECVLGAVGNAPPQLDYLLSF